MKKIITGLLAIVISISAISQPTENKREKSINVSGVAEMEVVPDEIYVNVELREYDKKGSGKINIESIKNNFLKAITSTGISENDISVQGYQGWDGNYWLYSRNKKKTPEMMAGITYQVKLNSTKKMDALVEKLDDEATQNFYIARVSHSKETEFKKQLKIQAIKAAREKAEYLAEAIGEKPGEAITINEPVEIGIITPHPMYANTLMRKENFDQAADAPVVDFKKIKYQFEVSVQFALK